MTSAAAGSDSYLCDIPACVGGAQLILHDRVLRVLHPAVVRNALEKEAGTRSLHAKRRVCGFLNSLRLVADEVRVWFDHARFLGIDVLAQMFDHAAIRVLVFWYQRFAVHPNTAQIPVNATLRNLFERCGIHEAQKQRAIAACCYFHKFPRRALKTLALACGARGTSEGAIRACASALSHERQRYVLYGFET